MTSPLDLGRLEKVELRNVWANEAGDFTPWLARDENIALLGEAIGLDLDVEAQEKFVGPFRADILCKDTARDEWVLIENQLERTNHSHLGQLLTYAAGLDAVTIVWIAQRFTDEHRATLDWLNRITDEHFNFFGLEVELWRIGNSAVAPKFNVISKPNDWTRSVRTGAQGVEEGELTDTRQAQLEYWTVFAEKLAARAPDIRCNRIRPHHALPLPVGRAGFWLSAFANFRDERIGVILYCNRNDGKASYRLLQAQKDAIEAEIGAALEWNEQAGQRRSLIMIRKPNTDPSQRTQWPEQHAWLVERTIAFHRTFSKRLRQLPLAEEGSGAEDLDLSEA